MRNSERYIQAACRKWHGDTDVGIDITNAVTPEDDGAWVHALLWVSDDELEPDPGPTYLVLYSRFLSSEDGYSDWQEDSRFTFDDDPDGQCARLFAHRRARELRNDLGTRYYVAVRDAAKQHSLRLPWNPSCPEHDFRDFSAAWLGL